MDRGRGGGGGRGGGRDFVGVLGCGTLVVLCFLVLLWHDPLLFWNDDYAISILPVFADVARSFSEGHWPLLSPYSWVCGNLAGEFQYGTFSVFVNAAVVLIWKFPLTFPQQAAALSLAHLFVLAMGGYLLGRERKLEPALALMIGLVAALNGWIVCWGATDWFGALGAFAWLPWAWWGMERALDPRRGRFRFLWPAPFVYLLITGGFPYTVVMLVVVMMWLKLKAVTQTRWIFAGWPLVGVLLGVGLAAPAWLALFDYVGGSAREAQAASSHWQWLVPPAALPGFIFPGWTVPWADFFTRMIPHPATELAGGFVPPVILLFAFCVRARLLVSRLKWELGLLAVLLILSMAPTAGMFRWSFRWLPLVHLLLAVCAAEAIRLLETERLRKWWKPGVFAFALLAVIGGAMALLHVAGPDGWRLFWFTLMLAAVWAVCDFLPAFCWRWPALTAAAFLFTYLCLPTNRGVPKFNFDQKLTQAAPLDPQRLYLSIYPPPEFAYRAEVQPAPFGTVVRPGSTSLWGSVRFINGYSPIRPAGVAREFDCSFHGELAEWAADYFPTAQAGPGQLLARLGVGGIIVAAGMEITPQPASEWALVHSSAEGRVYHRAGGVLPHIQSLAGNEYASAQVTQIVDSRLRISAEVNVPAGDKPAVLIFSRPFFRGYQATLDSRVLPVTSWRGLVPAVEVPAGRSGRLRLVYRPWWLLAGGGIALGSAGACLTALFFALRNSLGQVGTRR